MGGSHFPISKTFDQRERTFTWPAHLDSNITFTALITELKRYKGQRKQLNTQDLDYLSRGWKNIKLTDVQTNPIRAGRGDLRYILILKYIFTEEV